jgi:hypothetical protein
LTLIFGLDLDFVAAIRLSFRPESERQRRRSGEPALSDAEGNLLFPIHPQMWQPAGSCGRLWMEPETSLNSVILSVAERFANANRPAESKDP